MPVGQRGSISMRNARLLASWQGTQLIILSLQDGRRQHWCAVHTLQDCPCRTNGHNDTDTLADASGSLTATATTSITATARTTVESGCATATTTATAKTG